MPNILLLLESLRVSGLGLARRFAKMFALNSGWLEFVSGTEKRLNVVEYDVVIPGLTGYLTL